MYRGFTRGPGGVRTTRHSNPLWSEAPYTAADRPVPDKGCETSTRVDPGLRCTDNRNTEPTLPRPTSPLKLHR